MINPYEAEIVANLDRAEEPASWWLTRRLVFSSRNSDNSGVRARIGGLNLV